jgi:4-hydroxy-2-oxoheptanedioate aldolase
MRPNRVAELLAADQLALTGWISTGSAYLAEVMGHAGYDAVTIDVQHGMFGVESAIACLQAVSATPSIPLVRCRSLDAGDIGHLLDAGAYGVICPGIDDAEQAKALVEACRYPPAGRRSFGPARGLLYGGPDYARAADATVLAIGMVESAAALDHLDEIVGAGLDAVYVGPSDLAVSCGWDLMGLDLPTGPLAAAIERVAATARAAGLPAGVFATTDSQAAQFARWGYRLITPGHDVNIVKAEAGRRVAAVRASFAAARDD